MHILASEWKGKSDKLNETIKPRIVHSSLAIKLVSKLKWKQTCNVICILLYPWTTNIENSFGFVLSFKATA